MADKRIKCANYNQCKQEWNFIPIKGPNNTELCHKCGGNICFICGKKWQKEENFHWVEDYDCRGNKIMAKAYSNMFSQFEKDENHPEGDLTVYYCDEHQAEGEKSPNKWTAVDQEQLEKKKELEKLEREEKLNSQKDLFYCQDPHGRAVEWKQIEGIEYGCIYFQGRENGQNFNLLVPDTHPDLASFKYKEVEHENGTKRECTRWTLKENFYLVEGVEDLPLETSDMPNDFYKVVGLSDRITIASFEKDKEPENQNEEGQCNTCHKILEPGQEGVYVGNYQGSKSNRLHICYNCYQEKEQEYLQNYAFVYSYSPVRYQKKWIRLYKEWQYVLLCR